jgi:hypothetical protein
VFHFTDYGRIDTYKRIIGNKLIGTSSDGRALAITKQAGP